MADETKRTPTDQQGAQGGTKPPADKAAIPQNPAPAAAAAAGGHAAPQKPVGPAATPWEHERVARLKRAYGTGIKEALTYLGQNYLVADPESAFDLLRTLRDDDKFEYLVDVTCVHYPERAEPFEVVWILYSFTHNERMRVKAGYKEGEKAPSAVGIWPTANWLEREAYDMFGVEFDGHPDMRRILLPDGWKGFPLRKDYGITQQDTEWVKINLGIESGQ